MYTSPEIASPDVLPPAPVITERRLYIVRDLVEIEPEPDVQTEPQDQYPPALKGYSKQDIQAFEEERRERCRRLPDPHASLSYTAPGVRERSIAVSGVVDGMDSEEGAAPVSGGHEALRYEKSYRVVAAHTAVNALMAQCGIYPGQSLYNISSNKY